jgi:hypothetical protein
MEGVAKRYVPLFPRASSADVGPWRVFYPTRLGSWTLVVPWASPRLQTLAHLAPSLLYLWSSVYLCIHISPPPSFLQTCTIGRGENGPRVLESRVQAIAVS